MAAGPQLGHGLLAILLMTGSLPAPAIPVTGRVIQQSGNLFPSLDHPPPAAAAIGGQRVVAVAGKVTSSAPLLPSQALRAPIVAEATTDPHGDFRLNLPAGTVTLLLVIEGGYYLNSFDGAGHYSSVAVAPGLPVIELRDDRHSLH